jgi:hypothetical protein
VNRRYVVMVRADKRNHVSGGPRSSHETAAAAESEAARLRALGWHAVAIDQVAEDEAKRSGDQRAQAFRARQLDLGV